MKWGGYALVVQVIDEGALFKIMGADGFLSFIAAQPYVTDEGHVFWNYVLLLLFIMTKNQVVSTQPMLIVWKI